VTGGATVLPARSSRYQTALLWEALPNATEDLSGPLSRIVPAQQRPHTLFSFFKKADHVFASAGRANPPGRRPVRYGQLPSRITIVARRGSSPVKVKWKVALRPADLPGWKTCGAPSRRLDAAGPAGCCRRA